VVWLSHLCLCVQIPLTVYFAFIFIKCVPFVCIFSIFLFRARFLIIKKLIDLFFFFLNYKNYEEKKSLGASNMLRGP
jgi:hypothetical protein